MDYEDQLPHNQENERDDAPSNETGAAPVVPPQQAPATWYSVSYDGNGNPSFAVPQMQKIDQSSGMHQTATKKRRFSAKVAIGAALLAVCLVLFGFAGFGGYMVADAFFGWVEGNNSEGGYQPNNTPGGNLGNQINGSTGAPNYNYSGVVISQVNTDATGNVQNDSAGNRGMTLINAIAAVRDSVVEITTTTVSSRGQLVAGAGSGVIIHADGVIVTNNHVIEGASSIYVRLTNGNTYEAYLRGRDEENDIAVLKIQPQETLTVAKIAHSTDLVLGEEVFAIGNPLGELGGTVTNGIISALERQVQMDDGTMTLLQTNAAINAGNSGGGLFNMAGELVGVVNAKYSAAGVEGLAFAIPVDTAIVSVNALLQYGYIPGRASLGVSISETNVFLSGRFTTIPYVYETAEGSPLLQGDYIYKVGDTVVSSAAELNRAVRAYEVGDVVTLTIYRSGSWTEIEVTLVEYIPSDSSVNFGQ